MHREALFPENHQYLPDAEWLSSCFSVLRAGKVEAGGDYGVRRERYPGQDLIYCLEGEGTIETDGRRLGVSAGQLAWIANERPHAHRADHARPWTVLWVRMDGPDIVGCRKRLFGDVVPRVDLARTLVEPWFDRLFELLRRRDGDIDLHLNRLIAELLVLLRHDRSGRSAGTPPAALTVLLGTMRAGLERRWTTQDMCALAHVGPEQLRRWFRRHLGASPHRWLMRERVMHAQRLLLESDSPLADVATSCGYCDVYHLGREFRRAVGVAPATWRRAEKGGWHGSGTER